LAFYRAVIEGHVSHSEWVVQYVGSTDSAMHQFRQFLKPPACHLCCLSDGLQWWLTETLQHFPRILVSLGSGDDRELTLLLIQVCTFPLIVIYLLWRPERKFLNSAIYRVNLEPNLIRTTYRLRIHITFLLSVTIKWRKVPPSGICAEGIIGV
jgi:hypothetical protein